MVLIIDKKEAYSIASDNYKNGFNCSQSVMKSFLKICDAESDNLVKSMTGFGGGIALNGKLCGALAGGISALSLACGTFSPDVPRKKSYEIINDYYQNFIDEFSYIDCSDLNTGSFSGPEHIKNCSHISGRSAELVIETLEKFNLI